MVRILRTLTSLYLTPPPAPRPLPSAPCPCPCFVSPDPELLRKEQQRRQRIDSMKKQGYVSAPPLPPCPSTYTRKLTSPTPTDPRR